MPKLELKDEIRKIQVKGTGKSSRSPDKVEVSFGVVTEAKTPPEAIAKNSAEVQAIHSAVKGAGVEDRDFQTSQFQCQPVYSKVPEKTAKADLAPKIVSFRVSNVVHVTSRQVESFGELLAAVVGAGVNQINGIAFGLQDPTPLEGECRKLAAQDARKKAEQLAQELGATLGRPLEIKELVEGYRPVYGGTRLAAQSVGSSSNVPIAAGETEVECSVRVIFVLED